MHKSKRQSIVIDFVKKNRDVQISEIATYANSSQSTIRRDIKELASQGLLKEVYGSVIYSEKSDTDSERKSRNSINTESKAIIGKKAADLISDGQFVFIDAGSTTFQMIKHICAKHCTFVTGGIDIASELLDHGFEVIILGGQIKPITEAIVGESAVEALKAFYFDIAFIGTNGIAEVGYSTPDLKEGIIKKVAIERSRQAYVLSDTSKNDKITSFVFATRDQATWINEK